MLSLISLLSMLIPVAVVRYAGDVWPAAPGGLLPTGASGIDDDSDQIADWIDSGGHSARLGVADPIDPAGTGTSPGELDWDDARVWVNYDTPQNAIIGQLGYGLLEIDGASALRMQNIVCGGLNYRLGGPWKLKTVDSTPGSQVTPPLPLMGHGIIRVSGYNSLLNNHPKLIASELQAVLGFHDGEELGKVFTDLVAEIETGTGSGNIPPTLRDPNGHFDLVLGDTMRGELQLLNGGRAEVGNRLLLSKETGGRGSLWIADAHLHLGHTEAEAASEATDAMRSHAKAGSHVRLSDRASIEINPAADWLVEGNMTIDSGARVSIDGPLRLDGSLVLRCGAVLDGVGEITGSGTIYAAGNSELGKGVNGPLVTPHNGGVPARDAAGLLG